MKGEVQLKGKCTLLTTRLRSGSSTPSFAEGVTLGIWPAQEDPILDLIT